MRKYYNSILIHWTKTETKGLKEKQVRYLHDDFQVLLEGGSQRVFTN